MDSSIISFGGGLVLGVTIVSLYLRIRRHPILAGMDLFSVRVYNIVSEVEKLSGSTLTKGECYELAVEVLITAIYRIDNAGGFGRVRFLDLKSELKRNPKSELTCDTIETLVDKEIRVIQAKTKLRDLRRSSVMKGYLDKI